MNAGLREALLAPTLRGAPAPSQVVFGALAGNSVDFRAAAVFGEGTKDNTRGVWLLRRRPQLLCRRARLL